jgi:hypothetical protein
MKLVATSLCLFGLILAINANPLLSHGHRHHAKPVVDDTAPAADADAGDDGNGADVMDIISKFLADSTEDGGDEDGGVVDAGNNFCDAYGGCGGSMPSENIYAPSEPTGFGTDYQSQYPTDQGLEPSGDEEKPFDVSFTQTSQSTSKTANDKIINFNFIDQKFDIRKNKK